MDSEVAGSVTYPPEPWDLSGIGYLSVWLVPVGVLPELPDGVRPVSVLGRAVVCTGLVDYLPGGLMSYRELLATVLVREGFRPGITITHIWVDSPSSRAGGRELWGIPKELAHFDVAHDPIARGSATLDGEPLAEVRVRPGKVGGRLPIPLRGTVLQTLHSTLAHTPIRAGGSVRLARGGWRLRGPLGWLSPYRPLITLAATDFRLRFGPRAS
jgi:hypothetical protein